MAKPPFREDNDSLDPSNIAIGQNAEGGLDIFPIEELPARVAAVKAKEAEIEYAMDQADEDLDDISDL